ncbi:hypothetical protein Tco_0798161 [Tanacetum coccineum]
MMCSRSEHPPRKSTVMLKRGDSDWTMLVRIRETWVDPAEQMSEDSIYDVGEINTSLVYHSESIWTRQRVNLLKGEEDDLQETVGMVEEEAYASREAWAHSIGLSETHHSFRPIVNMCNSMKPYLQAHQTTATTVMTLIQHNQKMSDMQAGVSTVEYRARRLDSQEPELGFQITRSFWGLQRVTFSEFMLKAPLLANAEMLDTSRWIETKTEELKMDEMEKAQGWVLHAVRESKKKKCTRNPDVEFCHGCHAVIVCDEKLVQVPYGNETLTFRGNKSSNGRESRLTVISCSKAQEYMAKDASLFTRYPPKREDKRKGNK